MPIIQVLHYDAFSSEPNMGNPAGVVLEADHLSERAMQSIARSVGFNETVFVVRSSQADYRLRYFTPGHEINLCGHATMASMYCLKTRGHIKASQNALTIETNVGILPITFDYINNELMVTMKQDHPQFIPFQGSVKKLAESLGLLEEEIDPSMPIVYGSTGTWTLLVPIRNLESFNRMQSNNEIFPEILMEKPRSSVHPFGLETVKKEAMMHARHFSSPYSGTIEDAITGTASGVMGAYYLTYLDQEASNIEFIVEQGTEVHKDGQVLVNVSRRQEGIDVYISGTGVYVRELHVEFDG
ncbi:PhzF family phenazine biosynthesis isomerase [Paenibacillus sp. MER 99-2]|uniref:PhzF family phenazine biosynthesis isomerase n=1 Tax=Paenibacillus sp. MER 99-2 TaxID=2939572 RepID=UPI00203B4F69|nr:PhzF family phenazine biosynthesis isomerase [Paenibacillus sp. MER 99-2]MCM3172087.1 PhzF family phenazine biosynthesis isomerase [Paenibacillus sp. MER 99-2]